MYRLKHGHLTVFFDKPSEALGDGGVRTQASDRTETPEEENNRKQWLQETIDLIGKKATKSEAIKELQERTKSLHHGASEQYRKDIDFIRVYIEQALFGVSGDKKPNFGTGIVKLKQQLQIVEQPIIIPNPEKQTNLLYKNTTVEVFKNTMIQYCIDRPVIAEFGKKFQAERAQIQKLGNTISPEYGVIIETLLQAVQTPEYGKMTGFFSKLGRKLEGRSPEVQKFVGTLNTLVDASIKSGRPLALSHLDIQRNLNEEEGKLVEDQLALIRAMIATKTDTQGKLDTINEFIAELRKNDNGFPENVKTTIIARLNPDKKVLIDNEGNILTLGVDIIKTFTGRDDTEENRLIAETKRKKVEDKEKIPQYVYFKRKTGGTDGQGEYVVISIKDISAILEKDFNHIDAQLFKSIVDIKGWYELFKLYLSNEAFASIGAYITKKPDTQLFVDNPHAKDIVLEEYRKLHSRESELIQSKITENNTLTGDFGVLFPALDAKFGKELSEPMREVLKKGELNTFYQLLVETNITNGKILEYILCIEDDTKKLGARLHTEIHTESKEFLGKTLAKNYRNAFELTTDADKAIFDTIKDKDLGSISLNKEEIAFLFRTIKTTDTNDSLYQYLSKQGNYLSNEHIRGQAVQAGNITQKKDPTIRGQKLTDTEKTSIPNAGAVSQALGAQKLGNTLNENSGISHIGAYNDLLSIDKRIKELQIQNNPNDAHEIAILKDKRQKLIQIANTTSAFASDNPKEDVIHFLQKISDTPLSDTDISRWIDTQKYISTYVDEKGLVSETEKRAAMMNLRDSKSIGNLYGLPEKVDIAMMTSSSGSLSLGDTAIGRTSLGGISELMNCQITVGDSSYLTRTIRSPEGALIAANVPLSHLDSTIKQLGRFYTGGLGKLAPYMVQVGSAINAVRPDKITGLDGEYSAREDREFLEIFAIMLYGEESLPEDRNIPNLLRVFNSSFPKKSPTFILKQIGILGDDGGINTTKLGDGLRDASKQVT